MQQVIAIGQSAILIYKLAPQIFQAVTSIYKFL